MRDPTEYAAGHLPGAVTAPGGQLVQATDQYAGTLGARIVLIDDREVRAVMTASWLKQMGWRDVFVLAGERQRDGRGRRRRCSARRRRPSAPSRPRNCPSWWRTTASPWSIFRSARPIARATSPAPGSPSARGSPQALAKIPMNGELVLTSEDGVLAGLAASEAARAGALSARRQRRLAGRRASRSRPKPRMADEPLDYWPKPYERAGDTKDAMNEYLSWEVDLLPRIERDGTTRFMP